MATKRQSSGPNSFYSHDDAWTESDSAPSKASRTTFFVNSSDSVASIASNLLGALPHDALIDSPETKKLFEAFTLLENSIKDRTRRLRGGAIEMMLLGDEKLFSNVLSFLRMQDLVHGVSLVSKSWRLAYSKSDCSRLDGVTGGFSRDSEKPWSAKQLKEFLSQPRFRNLEVLQPPDSSFNTKSLFRVIAPACPKLIELNLWRANRVHNGYFLDIPDLFPSLSKIHVRLGVVDHIHGLGIKGDSLAAFSAEMGPRLLELSVCMGPRCYGNEAELVLSAVSKSCPMLKRLLLCNGSRDEFNLLGVEGFTALSENCPELKFLTLAGIGILDQQCLETFENRPGFTLLRISLTKHRRRIRQSQKDPSQVYLNQKW